MKKRNIAHLAIWMIGYILICLPNFNLTVGVFSGGDSSLLLTATYGTLFNALIFYGNANLLLPRFLRRHLVIKYLSYMVAGFLAITTCESLFDLVFYKLYYQTDLDSEIYSEVILGNLLTHIIFFLVPSYIYRFSLDWLGEPKTVIKQSPAKSNGTLSIKSGGAIHQVPIESLTHLESDGNYISYHYQNKKLLTRDSLTKALQSLPEDKFVRCHKSYIVSKKFTSKVDYDFVYFEDRKFPIGRVYRKDVTDFFQP